MGETEWWEEAIDVDDSDLPSLLHPLLTSSSSNPQTLPPLRPCYELRPPSQTLAGAAPQPQPPLPDPEAEEEAPPPENPSARRLIPGPAGAVQAAMHRKASATAAHQPRAGSCFEVEGREDQIDDTAEEDGDFKLNPWLCAMHFLGLGLDSAPSLPISSIKAHRSSTERVPQVVGIVNSCAPSGRGDLFITLKDPTGTLGASVHHKVFSESNIDGDISVGCVLILKQVVVFCPARSARYLNVTPNNVVKIISKDCGPPHKQMLPSLASKCSISGAAEREPSGRQVAENAADEASRSLDLEKTLNGGNTALTGNLPCSISDASVTTNMAANFRTREHMEVGPELAERGSPPSARDRAEATAPDDVARGNPSCERMIDRRKTGPPGSLACSTGATASATSIASKPDLRASEPKKPVSKVSAAKWTDEQLLELFTDYQDDLEFVHRDI